MLLVIRFEHNWNKINSCENAKFIVLKVKFVVRFIIIAVEFFFDVENFRKRTIALH